MNDEVKINLKLRLHKEGHRVIGKVIYQDTAVLKRGIFSVTRNGYTISSMYGPEIKLNTLFIRGNSEQHDRDELLFDFATEERAIEWLENICELVNEINGVDSSKKRAVIDNYGVQILPVECYQNEDKVTTVLVWKDGTKTKVKCSDDDEWNATHGFLMAYFEGVCGLTKNQASKFLKKTIPVPAPEPEPIPKKSTSNNQRTMVGTDEKPKNKLSCKGCRSFLPYVGGMHRCTQKDSVIAGKGDRCAMYFQVRGKRHEEETDL